MRPIVVALLTIGVWAQQATAEEPRTFFGKTVAGGLRSYETKRAASTIACGRFGQSATSAPMPKRSLLISSRLSTRKHSRMLPSVLWFGSGPVPSGPFRS